MRYLSLLLFLALSSVAQGQTLEVVNASPYAMEVIFETDPPIAVQPGATSMLNMPAAPAEAKVRTDDAQHPGLDFEFRFLAQDGYILKINGEPQPWDMPSRVWAELIQGATTALVATSDPQANAPARNVQFLATADCQFWSDSGADWVGQYSENAVSTLEKTGDLAVASNNPIGCSEQSPCCTEDEPCLRGVIVAGDLVQRTYLDEIVWYRTVVEPYSPYFYEGVGNHDMHYDAGTDPYNIVDVVSRRDHRTAKTRQSQMPAVWPGGTPTIAPLYSWDWDDVHFVQLGTVPGIGQSQGTQQAGEIFTFDSLHFLEEDLRTHVGNSGRPVVLIHHYYLGTTSAFATIESFTHNERVAYWNVIKDYNVAAILAGHNHVNPIYQGRYPWARPDGATNLGEAADGGPDSFETFVVGSASGQSKAVSEGAYTEFQINAASQAVQRRYKDDGLQTASTHYYSFGDQDFNTSQVELAPLFVDTASSRPGRGYGQSQAPFRELGQAVAAIQTSFSSAPWLPEPSEIRLASGHYDEDVTLSFASHIDDVKITANGSGCAVIGGSPTPGDTCGDAAKVCAGGDFDFVNTNATSSGPSVGCGDITRDVWFEWKAPTDGPVTIDTCSGVDVDTILAVYGGESCATGTALACDNDSCGPLGKQSSVTFVAEAGETYLIQVGTPAGQPGGAGAVHISPSILMESFDDPVLPLSLESPNAGDGVTSFATGEAVFTGGLHYLRTTAGDLFDRQFVAEGTLTLANPAPSVLVSQDFAGSSLPQEFESPNGGSTTFGGQATFSGGRHFLRTRETGFSGRDIVVEGTLTLGAFGADAMGWLGIGMGTNGALSSAPDLPHVAAEIAPGGHANGYFRAADNGTGPLNGQNNGGWGVGTEHRVRLTWNPSTGLAVVKLDQGNDGVFDFTQLVDGSDNGFTLENSRIFFGADGGSSWDDISIVSTPGRGFLGIGPGTNGGPGSTPDRPNIYAEVAPTAFATGYFRVNDDREMAGDYFGLSGAWWGPGSRHRVRLTWNPISQEALVELDRNYTGVFAADYSQTVLGSDNGFSMASGSVFFGADGGSSWDDVSVVAFRSTTVELDEDFSAPTLPSTLEDPDGGTTFADGEALFPLGGDRHYLRTQISDYLDKHFVAEGTLTLGQLGPDGIGFFGMGPGTNGEQYAQPDAPGIYAEIAPDGFIGGYFRTVDFAALPQVFGPFYGQLLGRWGVGSRHRVRLTWNPVTETAIVEVDRAYNGFFDADYSETIDGSDNGFTSINSSIFFGGNGGSSWDDVSIVVIGAP